MFCRNLLLSFRPICVKEFRRKPRLSQRQALCWTIKDYYEEMPLWFLLVYQIFSSNMTKGKSTATIFKTRRNDTVRRQKSYRLKIVNSGCHLSYPFRHFEINLHMSYQNHQLKESFLIHYSPFSRSTFICHTIRFVSS